MLSEREFLFRVFFRLRVHESSGDAFQALFSQVMKYSDARFQSIVPWGDWGDGGNDGWIEADGHYFQVYGPKPSTDFKVSCAQALNKAVNDFDKLPEKWSNVQMYSFVMNDRFQGIPGPIGSALQKLQIEKKLKHAKAVETKDLLGRFMELKEDERQDVIGGGIPSTEVDFVDPRALGELLTGLANRADGRLSFLHEIAPDFIEKINFNGLSPAIGSRLQASSYQISLVDEFLATRDKGLRQAIAQEMREYYQESKVAIPDEIEGAPDDRYVWLLERLIPDSAKKQPYALSAYRSAAEIVVAKYFETCDAYEHPNSAATA